MSEGKWKTGSFKRRTYTVQGDSLDEARKIELMVVVDGKTLVRLQAREPGMLAFVSRPDDQGFDLEVVEPDGRYTDAAMFSAPDEAVADWQLEALGLRKE